MKTTTTIGGVSGLRDHIRVKRVIARYGMSLNPGDNTFKLGCASGRVLFFIRHDCPICNRYVPEMNRIVQDYRSRGFGFTAVYSEVDFSHEDVQKHAREYHFDFPFVIDSDHRFAAQFGERLIECSIGARRSVGGKRELTKLLTQVLHYETSSLTPP